MQNFDVVGRTVLEIKLFNENQNSPPPMGKTKCFRQFPFVLVLLCCELYPRILQGQYETPCISLSRVRELSCRFPNKIFSQWISSWTLRYQSSTLVLVNCFVLIKVSVLLSVISARYLAAAPSLSGYFGRFSPPHPSLDLINLGSPLPPFHSRLTDVLFFTTTLLHYQL